MIIDTEKTDCLTCKYYQEYKTPKAVLYHPQINRNNIGKLMACNGVKGFGIVGAGFCCTNYELKKGK